MHELGLIVDVVDMVEKIAAEQQIARVKNVVVDVGELYMIIPTLMQSVYRSAVKGTRLEGSELELNEIEALADCTSCGKAFNPLHEDGVCPHCGESEYTVKAGKEFEIRQIGVYDERTDTSLP